MSTSKESKAVVYEEIKDKLSRAKAVVMCDYTGITVAEVTELRNSCRAAGVDYKVYKNTLVEKAAKELGIEGLEGLAGTNAFAFGYDDVVAPAKTLYEFGKKYDEKCPIKGGIMEGKPMSAAEEIALAKLPGKDALIVQLIWTLQGNVRNLAYALNAIKEKMEA